MTDDHPRTFLVTGASKGIGRASALELASAGHRVFAGVRDLGYGSGITNATGGVVTPLRLDVTDESSIREAAHFLGDEIGPDGLGGIVNNAGWMLSGPLEHLDLADVRRQFDTNAIGWLAVTQALLPLLRASRGRIVNIGSSGARAPGRFVGAYAASKAALDTMSTALRLELADAGIAVSIVEPGVVATGLWDHEIEQQRRWMADLPSSGRAHYGPRAERRLAKLSHITAGATPPEAVAAVVADALTTARPRPRYVVGRDARLKAALAQVLPERGADPAFATSLSNRSDPHELTLDP